NLKTSTDSRGNSTEYVYDELGRQTKITLPDPDGTSGFGQLETQTVYDDYGNRIKTIENRGTLSPSADRSNLYQYDQRNRLKEQSVDAGDANHENILTKYVYDAAGNRVSLIDPLAHETHYRYDALNRVIDEYQAYGEEGRAVQPIQFNNLSGSGVLANNNTSITLTGTAAASATFAGTAPTYHVTHRTVLEFDFVTANPAIFQVIGIDNNGSFSLEEKNHYFELGGITTNPGMFITE